MEIGYIVIEVRNIFENISGGTINLLHHDRNVISTHSSHLHSNKKTTQGSETKATDLQYNTSKGFSSSIKSKKNGNKQKWPLDQNQRRK